MFGTHHRIVVLAAILAATAALLVPCAQAAAQGQPRAMPSDYAAYFASQIEPGDYGMPRPTPADYAAAERPGSGMTVDWPSAGLGAGVMLALVLGALAIAFAVRGARLARA
jgi:hypothetical protein